MKHLRIVEAALAATLIWGGLSSTAAAAIDFTGSTVVAQAYYPDLAHPIGVGESRVIGPGIEFASGTLAGFPTTVDFSGSQIFIKANCACFYLPATFNGLVFVFSGAPKIVGLSVNPSSYGVFGGSNWFSGDTIWLNVASATALFDSLLLFDVTFENAVPEPTVWTLMILGFAMSGAMMRRRRVRQIA